jgi:hypothetical protein
VSKLYAVRQPVTPTESSDRHRIRTTGRQDTMADSFEASIAAFADWLPYSPGKLASAS